MWNKKTQKLKAAAPSEAGFTLIEAVVAILVLTIGLMGTAAAITYALEYGSISRNVSNAKAIIITSIEEIETLRNARRLKFQQIANAGNVDNTGVTEPFNGFSTGLQEISLDPGADGVNGTDDDLIGKGLDGVFGTPDDAVDPTLVRAGYRRQIVITNLSDSLKRVEITVQYLGRAGTQGEIRGVCYLNDEARVTR